MKTVSTIPPESMEAAVSGARTLSIDVLRGLVMVLMALDHARAFYADGFNISPTNLATTNAVLFFTRWVTHFCAPVFVFLAGWSAYLYGQKHTLSELRSFLLTRGLWLVLLELTVMRLGWTPDPFYRFTVLQVIWAIGWCMVALAAVCGFRPSTLLAWGIIIIAGHNALDTVAPEAWGTAAWLWKILHVRGVLEPVAGHKFMVVYPLLPWFGVIAAGFGFAAWATQSNGQLNRRRIFATGAGLIVLFGVMRGLNLYGDPVAWTGQKDAVFTLLSFLNCEKYPPSLMYLAMTLGPALCLLAWFDHARQSRWMNRLAVIGSVPLFYYVAHLLLLRYTSAPMAYARFGIEAFPPPPGHAGSPAFELWAAYLAWGVAVLMLYPLCRWFARIKKTRTNWWLRYL